MRLSPSRGACLCGWIDCGTPPAWHAKADDALVKVVTPSHVGGVVDAALQAAVKGLRSDGVSSGLIIDHAVAARCPAVAKDQSLSLHQKPEKYAVSPRGRLPPSTIRSDPAPTGESVGVAREIDIACAKAG